MNSELKQKLDDLNRYLADSEGIDESVREKLIESIGGIESAIAKDSIEFVTDIALEGLEWCREQISLARVELFPGARVSGFTGNAGKIQHNRVVR